ncbi:MAG: hypothetical protein ACREKS_03810 [Candidatus Rokuibacteriota bacterium]
MPLRDDHLGQARHNAQFYATIDKATFRDWAITVLFYTGLHYIDAVLAGNNIHPSKHNMRDKPVTTVKELRPIAIDYFALKNRSFNARYEPPTKYTDKDVSDSEGHLARIRAEMGRHVPI